MKKNNQSKLPSASESHFFFSIAGFDKDTFTVLSYESESQFISDDFNYNIRLFSKNIHQFSQIISKQASLVIKRDNATPTVHGIVTGIQHVCSLLGGEEYTIILQSQMSGLKLFSHNRVFIKKDIKAIVSEVLLNANIASVNFAFKLTEQYPTHEYIVQYDETDFEFVTRIIAEHGVFFRFQNTQEKSVILFYDEHENCPAINGRSEIPYIPDSGTTRSHETVTALLKRSRILSNTIMIKDYNYRTPETTLENSTQNTGSVTGYGKNYYYGENIHSLDLGEKLAEIHQLAKNWQRETFLIESDCRTIELGKKITISDHPLDSRNRKYLIVEIIDIHADQRAAQLIHLGELHTQVSGSLSDTDYKMITQASRSKKIKQSQTFFTRFRVIPSDRVYRTPIIARPKVHGSFTAVIESSGGHYAHLDEQGRYRIRMDFDVGTAEKAEATHPVRMAQSYTGNGYGLHFPLHNNSEVLVSCINGDINRPIILGAVANQNSTSPVDLNNNTQNILRTFGNNELVMEDKKNNEKIELFTSDKLNILSLDASQSKEKIRLATEQGEMEIKATKTIQYESKDSQYVDCGQNHSVGVENRSRVITNNKAITQIAKTDVIKTAENNVNWRSETENIEINVAKDMIVEVNNNCSYKVKNNNMSFNVVSGKFHIEVTESITFKGKGLGSIKIEQAGGKIEIDQSGNILIEGTTVNIDGQSVKIKGGIFNNK